jgi:hypothetical protein
MPDPEAMTPAQRKAALGYSHNFARVLRVAPDRIEFGYDLDPARWPWLTLPPRHPIVLDKIQYFSAVTASLVSGSLEPGTRSALTRIGWSCRGDGERHATRGVLEPWSGERRAGYRLAVFDDAGREIARIQGEGFAFADRDFDGWRARAKVEARAAAGKPPEPAALAAAGLGPGGHCFVSAPFLRSGTRVALAQIGAANGFHPAHPFHTGTGDHVNAAHLFDCALQAAHLMTEPAGRLVCTGGEAEFLRFVELDVPFEIRLSTQDRSEAGHTLLGFAIDQLGRENARIALEIGASREIPA